MNWKSKNLVAPEGSGKPQVAEGASSRWGTGRTLTPGRVHVALPRAAGCPLALHLPSPEPGRRSGILASALTHSQQV